MTTLTEDRQGLDDEDHEYSKEGDGDKVNGVQDNALETDKDLETNRVIKENK